MDHPEPATREDLQAGVSDLAVGAEFDDDGGDDLDLGADRQQYFAATPWPGPNRCPCFWFNITTHS